MPAPYTIQHATWLKDRAALRDIRERVFMQEQHVPAELEWDVEDEKAFHLLAFDSENKPIACVRLLQDGHIGRMAVLPAWRGQGIGSALLCSVIEAAREQGLGSVFLDAQTHALGFYQQQGFIAEGEPFMDAGIPHRRMYKIL